MLSKKTLGVLILAIAGLGAIDAANIPLRGPQTPSNVPKVVQPTPSTLTELEAVREALRSSESISQLVGLFAALAAEIEQNRNLETMADLRRLNELLFSDYLPRMGFDPVPGLGSEIDKFIFHDDDRLTNPDQALTTEIRKELARRYRALEWVIQNDSDP